ncbi:serine protease inhibitor I/II-like [Uranotaenia lowii]|uniref:serine protease inhibitor I/II-like n=1 Tax=Uranotaenia lowii TaxID=190385 RepID=UPI00247B2605|nr:serine protease inhibitor I/II-like [Uranotaenia lowii]
MRSLLFIAALLIVAAGTDAFNIRDYVGIDPDFSCEPGSDFMKNCNSCRCDPDGKSASCTLMACGRCGTIANAEDPESAEYLGFHPDFRCTPGSTFKDKCNNTCYCHRSGTTAACTYVVSCDKNRKTAWTSRA